MKKPIVLIILDGWGHAVAHEHNGIELAKKPHFDSYLKDYPHTYIDGSGKAVGLPAGIMGNSEVGHMNLGAGRIVFSGLSQIYQAIEEGAFDKNPALLTAINASKKNDKPLHLMGLLSDGAVHSHQDHLYQLLRLAKKEGVKEVFVHCFMDGRDTPPESGLQYLQKLEQEIKKIGIGKIASVSGRYYAMDRDQRWERVQKAYEAMTGVSGESQLLAEDIIKNSYAQKITDEFIVPTFVSDQNKKPIGVIDDHSSIIFFNFRPDRAREITQAFTDKNFVGFSRKVFPELSAFVCMSVYDARFNLPVAFTPQYPKKVFAEVISNQGLKQLRIAETEKYAHVTYFFNGGVEQVFNGEDRVLIPSPKEVATYDHKPEMGAYGITEEVLKRIQSNQYDVIVLNFANADMVGHTAKPEAIIKAVEVIDECLHQIVVQVRQAGGAVLITADHGNAEKMVDEAGNPHTAHTTNLVPFILIDDALKSSQLKSTGGRLCDVAPTILKLLDIPKPIEMTGESLIV